MPRFSTIYIHPKSGPSAGKVRGKHASIGTSTANSCTHFLPQTMPGFGAVLPAGPTEAATSSAPHATEPHAHPCDPASSWPSLATSGTRSSCWQRCTGVFIQQMFWSLRQCELSFQKRPTPHAHRFCLLRSRLFTKAVYLFSSEQGTPSAPGAITASRSRRCG